MHERVAAAVAEVLAHRARRCTGAMYCSGAGSEADAATTIVYSIAPAVFERLDDLRDRRLLLADRDVDADDVLCPSG